jgi:hypothetical protein
MEADVGFDLFKIAEQALSPKGLLVWLCTSERSELNLLSRKQTPHPVLNSEVVD